MALTVEQRAKRRCKKKNKAIEKELPLFAGTPAISQFLTNEATEQKNVERWDQINERYFALLDEGDRAMLLKANEYKRQILDKRPDLFEHFATELERKTEKWPAFKEPEYIADYWHECLNKLS